MSHTHEPDPLMTPDDDGRSLIIDLPPMTDEAAYQLSELLRRIWETFDAAYDDQLTRAYHKRQEERQRLFYERCMQEDQPVLPFDDELF
jgi:hypothetical protein